jgi:hypothetical protein
MLSVSFGRLAVFVLLSVSAKCLSTELSPKPIIIDTDIFSDVDDIGAIAVANTLHICGIVDLRAVIINTPSEYGALAASVSTLYDEPKVTN